MLLIQLLDGVLVASGAHLLVAYCHQPGNGCYEIDDECRQSNTEPVGQAAAGRSTIQGKETGKIQPQVEEYSKSNSIEEHCGKQQTNKNDYDDNVTLYSLLCL